MTEADDDGSTATTLTADDRLPTQDDFRQRKFDLESFSSIGHRLIRGYGRDEGGEVFSLVDEMRRDDDEPVTGLALDAGDTEPLADLPGGTGMGSMFHHIFETIDFQAVMDGPADILDVAALRRVVETAMARFRIDIQWAPSIGRIIAHTLRRPIALDNTHLHLGQLTPAQRRHEIEFYFPLRGPLANVQDGIACGPDSGACREMVIRGFIDLVFTWRDRYYIADWKSNRLPQGYDQDAMAREMAAAGYDLQYQLYTLSTLRWLRQRLGERFDPQRHFGGVLYLFIRGGDGGPADGVFHVPPKQLLPVEALEATIKQRIGDIPW
jgi:exodeoxyribonuclease V beta subunit